MGELRAALPLLTAAATLRAIGRMVCDRAYSSLG